MSHRDVIGATLHVHDARRVSLMLTGSYLSWLERSVDIAEVACSSHAEPTGVCWGNESRAWWSRLRVAKKPGSASEECDRVEFRTGGQGRNGRDDLGGHAPVVKRSPR